MRFLWSSWKPVLCARKDLESTFHRCGGCVKLVKACLCASKDLESSFHQFVCPVKLVQFLFVCGKGVPLPFYLPWKCSEGRTGLLKCLLKSSEARRSLFMCVKCLTQQFIHSIGPVKLVQACLCARNDLESGFHHYGGSARLVQACLSVRKELESSFNVEACFMSCEARASLFKCQESARKQFSPLWNTCEARASQL